MSVAFGVVLLVNGQPVALQPKPALEAAKKIAAEAGGEVKKEVATLKATGMELELAERVELGSLGEGKAGLEKLISRFQDEPWSFPPTKDLPEAAADVVEKLEQVEIAVENFYLRIPPRTGATTTPAQKDKDPIRYRVGLSAMLPDGQEVGVDGIPVEMKGVFLQVDNMDKTTK